MAASRLKYLIFFSAFLISIPLWASVVNYAASPSQGTTTSPAQVMLVMSVDQQLFQRAYSDYTDLEGDGTLDTNYKNSFDYVGYFDSNWCYKYDTVNRYYSPVSRAGGIYEHTCTDNSSAPWSGNFLNWVSMSRMDIVRMILFGGHRDIDTDAQTILERVSLSENLSGAWVKVYDGSDIDNYTPYNNATSFCNSGLGANSSSPTILRISQGSYKRWATTEVHQCRWGITESPAQSEERATHHLRVEVCSSGKDASNEERCKQYPNGNFKPIGVLQRYGEDGQIHFGLISGSYAKNSSGGVLRSNTKMLAGNAAASDDEINLNSGIFNSSVNGIINHISSFTLTAWRNPVAEMYLEALRYFSGSTSPTPAFDTSDSNRGHVSEQWVTPLDSTNPCASCAIILISSGTNSFDTDNLDSSTDVTGLSDPQNRLQKMNELSRFESSDGFVGNYYYGGSTNSCTLKPLNGLAQAIGICPDAANIGGGYGVAGFSFHARTTDLHPTLPGVQDIKTYVIQLAELIPSLEVNVDGKLVSFQPLAQGQFFKGITVESQSDNSGEYVFIWDDRPEGGDNDYDGSSRIKYCVGSTCSDTNVSNDQIKLQYRFDGKNTSGNPSFSYSIFGTDRDGINSHFLGPGRNNQQQQGAGPFRSEIYTAKGTTSGVLPTPLQLAAKYGGFVDLDNSGSPQHDANGDGTPDDDSREWDFRNNSTSSLGADGIPDNFFFARNPSLLRAQLDLILQDISTRISSGTSAALVSNSSSGIGTVVQALFRPKVSVKDIEISWVGLMHSLFVDSNGHLREDTNGNDTLDSYATDKVVVLFFDASINQTVVQRYNTSDNGVTLTPDGPTANLDTLRPIWSASEQLMSVNNVTTQRPYNSPANTGRHILTWIDSDRDNQVNSSEVRPFDVNTFGRANQGYFGDVPNINNSLREQLVNYIRGEDQPGFRSRSVDIDNDGNLEVWRLGDIIHSSPASVGPPSGFYTENRPFNSNDATFINFQNQYKDRRQMVYVGSNDGKIHAFNGGFWDSDNDRFLLTNGSETRHPLGSEIWAYTPMNLLPHLQWLIQPDYPHVYYMDGEPLIFDANIFSPSSTYPDGWGTVLVMGMRLGGGPIDANIGGTTRTMRSAYVVLDITDPEQPPRLLAEITHPELGFTTNRPVVIQHRLPDSSGDYSSPSENNWYLAFGSGPIGTGTTGTRDALDNATSNQNMKVFIYDLQSNNFVNGFAPRDSGIPASYAGNMKVADWDNNFFDDAVYFGNVQTSGALSGQLMRINLGDSQSSNWSLSSMVDVGRPITASPQVVTNSDNERWVFAGTGRELTQDDSRSTAQEYFFGVKEPISNGTFTYNSVPFNRLIDTTDVQVRADGNLSSAFTVRSGSTVGTFENLLNAIKSQPGWVNRLEHTGNEPSGKSLSTATNIFALLLMTEYVPPADQCLIDGFSFLRAFHYQTGTAIPANVQAVLTTGTITDATISAKRISIGAGQAPAPVIHQNKDGKTSVLIQGGAGNISSTDLEYKLSDEGRQSWRQIFELPR